MAVREGGIVGRKGIKIEIFLHNKKIHIHISSDQKLS